MTSKWEEICPADEIPTGTVKKFELGNLDILIVHSGNKFYACSCECPEGGESLEECEIHGHVLACIEHGCKMDISNGKCLTEGELEIAIFRVEVRDDKIWVKI
ncbi:MAG: nitrite reductase (NAD(P)H) small subunit [Elusimicrobiota bacterium]